MTMNCPFCGTANPDDSVFCKKKYQNKHRNADKKQHTDTFIKIFFYGV